MMSQDQILFLLRKHVQGKLSAEEKQLLEAFLANDPANEALYQYLENHKRVTPIAASETDYAFNQLWRRIESEKDQPNDLAPTSENSADGNKTLVISRNIISRFKPLIVAASIILLASASLWYFNESTEITNELSYSSPKGEKKIINLPDGSTVWLNSDSRLILADDFGKNERLVTLVGEAFFSVAEDKTQPFIVSYKDSEVKVLGTKFNIRAYPDEVQSATSLVEGSIELKADKDKEDVFKMLPGEKLEILPVNAKSRTATSSKPNIEIRQTALKIEEEELMPSETLWLENKLSFNEDPLPLVVSKLAKWYNADIRLENAALQETSFSGIMEGHNLDQVLKILTTAKPGLQIKRENKSIIIY